MKERIIDAFNWPLLGVVVTLLAIGLLNLYSAVSGWEGESAESLFWTQLVWIGIGLVMMALFSLFDYRLLESLAYPIFFMVLLLLATALLFGPEVRGHRGWIALGPIRLQPAEFAKLAYLLVAVRYLSNNPNPDGLGFSDLWQPLLLMLAPTGLIMAQGDLGSALFLICIFISLVWFARIQRRTLIVGLLLAALAGGALYTFGLKEYQRARIMTFLNPEADVRGRGYHLMQSKIAVGSGKFFGKGYLKGNINKLKYLPERHTDFIFPVLAEEWGFFGSSIVLGFYAALLLMGVEVARKARDRFGAFLAIGIVAMVFWQLVINLGGVLGLMPLTGVTLPFLSYGGSSMVVTLAAMGVLLSISYRRFMF